MLQQEQFVIETEGRGFYPITQIVDSWIAAQDVAKGLCNIFLAHTSASLIFCENADPDVLQDLEKFFAQLVPDGDAIFKHTAEGKDDMPAHIRTVLTQNSLVIPIVNHRLALGTWQGIYLWEHRLQKHKRIITCTLMP